MKPHPAHSEASLWGANRCLGTPCSSGCSVQAAPRLLWVTLHQVPISYLEFIFSPLPWNVLLRNPSCGLLLNNSLSGRWSCRTSMSDIFLWVSHVKRQVESSYEKQRKITFSNICTLDPGAHLFWTGSEEPGQSLQGVLSADPAELLWKSPLELLAARLQSCCSRADKDNNLFLWLFLHVVSRICSPL